MILLCSRVWRLLRHWAILAYSVRESGTEPVVRVMVEAPDHDTCQKYVDEVVNVICEK